MSARFIPAAQDPVEPVAPTRIEIVVNGFTLEGTLGQSLAGVMLGADTLAWRSTSFCDRPRGVFCGIGICFDCLVVVNGQRDVRACQRRAAPGDVVEFHRDEPLVAREDRR